MKHKNSISGLFTALNIFLFIIVFAAGIFFYAAYLFKSDNSGFISAFGYSLHVAGEPDKSDSVKENTLITSKEISTNELFNGILVTVVKKDGTYFSARYYKTETNIPQSPLLFMKDGSIQTIAVTQIQIDKIYKHLYHSDILGGIFTAFSKNRNVLLIVEFVLFFLLVFSIIFVIYRRENLKPPKASKKQLQKEQLVLNKLISVEHFVPFEKSKVNEENKK